MPKTSNECPLVAADLKSGFLPQPPTSRCLHCRGQRQNIPGYSSDALHALACWPSAKLASDLFSSNSEQFKKKEGIKFLLFSYAGELG